MSDEARDAINAIKKFVYDTAVIVLMNPNDLEEMSKSDFPDYKFAHAHFVAERAIENGFDWITGCGKRAEVIAWMPLPPAYKEGESS